MAFIRQIAEELSWIGSPPSCLSTYVRELSRAIAQNDHGIERCTSGEYLEKITDEHEQELEYFRTLQQTPNDALAAAAAAVGNVAAVRLYIDLGADPLADERNPFGNPLQAACNTGKTDCLKIMLEHVKQEHQAKTKLVQAHEHGRILACIEKATQRAVSCGHASSALLLIEYIDHEYPEDTVYRKHLLSNSRLGAAKGGCIELFKALMERKTYRNKFTLSTDMQEAIREAVNNGSLSIVQHLLESKTITTTSKAPSCKSKG